MNGRKIFENYGRYIDILVAIVSVFPKKTRIKRLAKLRNKDGKIGFLLRYVFVKSLAHYVGKNVAIFPNVYFENIENLSIGDNVSIHQMCYIDAEGGISIGNNVSIAHRSTVLSSNHSYNNISQPIKYQPMVLAETVIRDNVWIGCSCTILAGVVIESGCVIGANSTVTRAIAHNCVAVGSPAKVIKQRG